MDRVRPEEPSRSAHPAAQAMRPQFGSCPYTAAFTRLLPAMERATALAAVSSAAPLQVTSMRHVAPSPSHAIDLARPCGDMSSSSPTWSFTLVTDR